MVFKLIRSVLGLGSSESSSGTDRTVDGESDEPAAAGTDAAASTGSMTAEPPEQGAAEPAEAAGPTAEVDEADAVSGEETEAAAGPVEEVSGIGQAYAQRLNEAGVETVADLLAADPDDLADASELSAKRIGRWQDRAEDR